MSSLPSQSTTTKPALTEIPSRFLSYTEDTPRYVNGHARRLERRQRRKREFHHYDDEQLYVIFTKMWEDGDREGILSNNPEFVRNYIPHDVVPPGDEAELLQTQAENNIKFRLSLQEG